jgi:hypothetical protein
MRESVRCSGTMRFAPAIGGRGTRLNLDLELTGFRGWAGVETIANSLIATNFRKLVAATVQLIESDPTPAPQPTRRLSQQSARKRPARGRAFSAPEA